ncbi:MAG TPA: hypothetical protein EYP57_08655 [Thermodesulfobacteriaceae bacterium]|nr:hypothetical protein [Thermodesulfobacteriaceae bacterium]
MKKYQRQTAFQEGIPFHRRNLVSHPLHARKFRGTVTGVHGMEVDILIEEGQSPSPGDKILSETILGRKRLAIGTWKIEKVSGNTVHAAVVEQNGMSRKRH